MKKAMWQIRKLIAVTIATVMCVGVIPCNIYAGDEAIVEEIQAAEEVQVEESAPVEEVVVEEVPAIEVEPTVPEVSESSVPAAEVAVIISPNVIPAVEPFTMVAVPADLIVPSQYGNDEDDEEELVSLDADDEDVQMLEEEDSALTEGNEDLNIQDNEYYDEDIDKTGAEDKTEESVTNEKGDGTGGAGSGESGGSSYSLIEDSVRVNRPEGASASPTNGSQNRYIFTFKATETKSDSSSVDHEYSAYVYGNGVNEEVCSELAKIYFNSLDFTSGNNSLDRSGFTDADKTSKDHNYVEGYDSNLCWAYSASNALWQTEWIEKVNAGIFSKDSNDNVINYFETVDDISSYAAYCFTDVGGDEANLWNWFFTGNANDATMYFGVDSDDALLYEYFNYDNNLDYDTDLYTKYSIDESSDTSSLAKIFDMMNDYDLASTLGIYYFTKGGHAMSITGYIMDNNVPVAVIVTDPDDGVKDVSQNDDPREKKNTYCVYPIKNDSFTIRGTDKRYENVWYFEPCDKYDARLGDISMLVDSTGKGIKNASIIPTSLRAISDSFDNSKEYSIDNNLSLDAQLNTDFLSFYDITRLKYRFIDENNNVLTENYLEYTKSYWKDMISRGITNASILFGNALDSLKDGKYNLQVEVDTDCFRGNYGWFAERYINTDGKTGYFDSLINVWVNLFRGSSKGSAESEDNYNYDFDYGEYEETSDAKTGVRNNSIYDDILNDFLEQFGYLIDIFVQGLLDDIDIELDIENNNSSYTNKVVIAVDDVVADNNVVVAPIKKTDIKNNVQFVINDFIKAYASDPEMITRFSSAGVDINRIDVKRLNVIYSSSVKMNKAGKLKFNSKSIRYKDGRNMFALIELKDGTTRYVKVNLLKDGSIEVELPDTVKEITIFSFL